ncbi:MAG: RDD family protein [Candidatus Hodarchaeota archaeon]
MSEKRLKYETSPIGSRLIALVIDLVIVAILAVIFTFLGQIDWFFIEQIFNFGVEYVEIVPIVLICMIIFSLLVYFIVVPSLTDGQTVGKIVMGLHVVYNDNSSTKKKFSTHTKRLFFMRQGTKVVKIVDERPEGL